VLSSLRTLLLHDMAREVETAELPTEPAELPTEPAAVAALLWPMMVRWSTGRGADGEPFGGIPSTLQFSRFVEEAAELGWTAAVEYVLGELGGGRIPEVVRAAVRSAVNCGQLGTLRAALARSEQAVIVVALNEPPP
jgi:hypothetical protein